MKRALLLALEEAAYLSAMLGWIVAAMIVVAALVGSDLLPIGRGLVAAVVCVACGYAPRLALSVVRRVVR